MKRLVILACLAALALPAASFAGNGPDAAAIEAQRARAQANAAAYTAKCKVEQPAPRCAEVKARMVARLAAREARLETRIATLEQRPASAQKTAALTRLTARLARVNALQTRL